MSAVDTQVASPPALAGRVAVVLAQLEPIRSRRALLDSYRSESLFRLAPTTPVTGSAAEVLDLAYTLRWQELAIEPADDDPIDLLVDGLGDE